MKKEQLSALTVKELKAMAKENGLKGYSKLRKADLVELLTTEVTFEEVCNKASEEVHYWNGDNECLSVYEYLNKNTENIGFNPQSPLVEKLHYLVKECDYVLEDVLCNGKNYNAPNPHTMSGELYFEDKSEWLTKVNDTIAYKSYLLYLIDNQAKEEVALDPETVFTKIENGTYKVLKTEGNEWQVLDENKNILEDVYVNSGYTDDFEINIDGISYDKMDIERNNAINKDCDLKLSHETLSMLSELAYYKCADEGSMTEGTPLSTRIENTVKDFAIKHSQKEKLAMANNLSVCLHTMTIYKDGVSIEMEFWYPLIEELGLA